MAATLRGRPTSVQWTVWYRSLGSLQKLVVGLGNPGQRYSATRHNIGFAVLDRLHARFSGSTPRSTMGGRVSSVVMNDSRPLLVWPQTYMNNSGQCVKQITAYYKIDSINDLLIVCDDLSLPLGKLRLRGKGSAGGQKGLADILRQLGSESVPRLRIGIDSPPPGWDAADFVLGRFSKPEQPLADEAIERACSAVEAWCLHGLGYAMNQFN